MQALLQNWTRKAWLATWAQGRRRKHQGLLPAPVLVAQSPSLAVWTWAYADPARWNAYNSLDGGATWQFDDWVIGSARQYAPDGGQHLMFIVGVDANGKEITRWSNAVRPDDASAPAAPVITDGSFAWGATEGGLADVWVNWTFNRGGFPVGTFEVWMSSDASAYTLLITVAGSETGCYYASACGVPTTYQFKVRYVNGGTVGPFSNVFQVVVV